MKKVLLGLLGSLFLSNTAFALPNNVQLDYIEKTNDSSSEKSYYYSGDKFKREIQKNLIQKGKKSDISFITDIFDSKKNEFYTSNNSLKTFHLFKNATSDKVDVRLIFPYKMMFNELENTKKLESNLLKNGLIKKVDEKIKLLNKEFDCFVFERTTKIGYKSKIWISKELMFPIKEMTINNKGKFFSSEELTSFKENVVFEKDFFVPSKSSKIEIEKASYSNKSVLSAIMRDGIKMTEEKMKGKK